MNFKQMMAKQLSDRGMLDKDADRLVESLVKDASFCEPMHGHWNKAINDYPQAMCASILTALWPVALQWIEKNEPNAWYLAQFTPEYQKLEGAEREAYVNDFLAIRDLTIMAFASDPRKKPKKAWGRASKKKNASR